MKPKESVEASRARARAPTPYDFQTELHEIQRMVLRLDGQQKPLNDELNALYWEARAIRAKLTKYFVE